MLVQLFGFSKVSTSLVLVEVDCPKVPHSKVITYDYALWKSIAVGSTKLKAAN